MIVVLTSTTGAKADITRDKGDVTFFEVPSCSQVVCIESESLPTGMTRPSLLQRSKVTALTVSYNACFCASVSMDDIQFAENLMSLIFSTEADKILVMASPTANRPEAEGFKVATGVRSPIAMASPRKELWSLIVTPTSLTGICQGPTN